MARNRFELSTSPVDGKVRRWETVRASSCLDLSTGEPVAPPGAYDYDLQVITGVYRRRKDVFAEFKRNRRTDDGSPTPGPDVVRQSDAA